MTNSENKTKRDLWGKIEVSAKFIASTAAVLGAVLIPVMLNKQAEENRKSQVYAQIMSQRESKDTDIREKMFGALLSRYMENSSDVKKNNESPQSIITGKNDIHTVKDKVMFLELLMENFLEYFSSKPLFEDLYTEIDSVMEKLENSETFKNCKGTCHQCKDRILKCEEKCLTYCDWHNLRNKLVKVSRRVASKETTMLSRVGLVSSNIVIKQGYQSSTKIPLFEFEEKSGNQLIHK